jgi:hypothetical protein
VANDIRSGVDDTADHQKSQLHFTIENLSKYKAICKKDLSYGAEAQIEMFDEKQQEVENLATGSL